MMAIRCIYHINIPQFSWARAEWIEAEGGKAEGKEEAIQTLKRVRMSWLCVSYSRATTPW